MTDDPRTVLRDQIAARMDRWLGEQCVGEPFRTDLLAAAVMNVVEEAMTDAWRAGRRQAAEALRNVATSRREYLATTPNDRYRESLEAEVNLLDSAARIADGDLEPLYGLLPSWRWTDEMHDHLRAEGSVSDG